MYELAGELAQSDLVSVRLTGDRFKHSPSKLVRFGLRIAMSATLNREELWRRSAGPLRL